MDVSDPRMTGDAESVVDCLNSDVDGVLVGECWGTAVIRNENGAWGGVFSGTTREEPGAKDPMDLVYLGSGDYAGLQFVGSVPPTRPRASSPGRSSRSSEPCRMPTVPGSWSRPRTELTGLSVRTARRSVPSPLGPPRSGSRSLRRRPLVGSPSMCATAALHPDAVRAWIASTGLRLSDSEGPTPLIPRDSATRAVLLWRRPRTRGALTTEGETGRHDRHIFGNDVAERLLDASIGHERSGDGRSGRRLHDRTRGGWR